MQLHVHPDGSLVSTAGAAGRYFHVVVDGSARVLTPHGSTDLRPGDYFGELALVDGEPRSTDVVAEGALTTLQLARTPFTMLLREEPAVTRGLIRGLVTMVRDVQRLD
jgi:CRP-like cAMP-binding protein